MDYVLAETKSLDAVQQPVKSSTRIKYTCVSVSDRFIVIGTSTGSVYVFDRETLTYRQGLVVEQDGCRCAVSHVALCKSDDNLIASAFSSGVIVVSVLEGSGRQRSDKVLRHVTLLKDNSITALTWEADGSKVIAGAENGFVCAVNVVNKRNEYFLPPAEVIMRLDSTVVQIDACANSVAVSTATRTYLCFTDKQQFKQIGKKIRDTKQGACFYQPRFHTPSHVPSDPVLYCARPGSRMWEVNGAGEVVSTHQFKRLLDVPPRTHISVLESLDDLQQPSVSPGPQSIAFKTLQTLGEQYLVTMCEKGLFVFNPSQIKLLFWTDSLTSKGVINMCTHKNDIYFLHHGNQLRRFSLMSIPKVVSHLYNEGLTAKCIRILTIFKGSLLSNSTKLAKYGIDLNMLECLKEFVTKPLESTPQSTLESENCIAALEEICGILRERTLESPGSERSNSDKKHPTEFKRSDSDIFVGKPRSDSTESNTSAVDDSALVQRLQEFQGTDNASLVAMESTPLATTSIAASSTKDPDTVSRTSIDSMEGGDKIKNLKSTAKEQIDKAQSKLSGFKSKILQRVTSIGTKEDVSIHNMSIIEENTDNSAISRTDMLDTKNEKDGMSLDDVTSTKKLDEKCITENRNTRSAEIPNLHVDNMLQNEGNSIESSADNQIPDQHQSPEPKVLPYIPEVVIDNKEPISTDVNISQSIGINQIEAEFVEDANAETLLDIHRGLRLGPSSPDAVSMSSEEISFTAVSDQPDYAVKSGRATPTLKSKKKKAKVISFDGNSTEKIDSTKKMKKSKSDSSMQSRKLFSLFSSPDKPLPESQSNPSIVEITDATNQSEAATHIAEVEISEEEEQGGLARRLSKASLNVVKDKLQTKAKSLVQTIKDTKEKINPKTEFLQQPLDVAADLRATSSLEKDANADIASKTKPKVDLHPLEEAKREAMRAIEQTGEDKTDIKPALNAWAKVLNSMLIKTLSQNDDNKPTTTSETRKATSDNPINLNDQEATTDSRDSNTTVAKQEKDTPLHLQGNSGIVVSNDTIEPNEDQDMGLEPSTTSYSQDELKESKHAKNQMSISVNPAATSADGLVYKETLVLPIIHDPFNLNAQLLQDVRKLATLCFEYSGFGDIGYLLLPNLPKYSAVEERFKNKTEAEPTDINITTSEKDKVECKDTKVLQVNDYIPMNEEAALWMRAHFYALDVSNTHAYVVKIADAERRYRVWRVLIECLKALAEDERAFCDLVAREDVQGALQTLRTATITNRNSYLGCVFRLYKLVPKWTLHLCASADVQIAVDPLDVLYMCRDTPNYLDHVVDYITLCVDRMKALSPQERIKHLDTFFADQEVYEEGVTALIKRGRPEMVLSCECLQMPLPGAHHVTWSTGNVLAEVIRQQRHPDVEYRLLRHCLQNGYWGGYIRLLMRSATLDRDHLATVVMQLYDVTLIRNQAVEGFGYWPETQKEWKFLLDLKDKLHNKRTISDFHQEQNHTTIFTDGSTNDNDEPRIPSKNLAQSAQIIENPSDSSTTDKWCLHCRKALPTVIHPQCNASPKTNAQIADVTPQAHRAISVTLNQNEASDQPIDSNENEVRNQPINDAQGITWEYLAALLLEGVGGSVAIEMLQIKGNESRRGDFSLPFAFYQQCVMDAIQRRKQRNMLESFVAKVDQHYKGISNHSK